MGPELDSRMTRRELLGYWPIVMLSLVAAAVTVLTVTLNLGGGA